MLALFGQDEYFVLNGISGSRELFELSVFAVIFVLPIFTIVTAPVFRDGTAKNEVTWGTSRTTLYVARLLIVTVLCILMRAILIGFGMLTATIIGEGLGDTSGGFWAEFFLIFGTQLFLFIAVSWVGVFLVFTIKNGFVVIEVFLGLMFAPTLLMQMLEQLNVNPSIVSFISNFDIATGITQLANLGNLETREILLILALGVFWMAMPTVIGLLKFQKAEIR